MIMVKKLAIAAAGAAFVSLGSVYLNIPTAEAAIFAVGDSGSGPTKSDPMANNGFDMVTVPNSQKPEFSLVSALSSPFGDLNFSSNTQELVTGSGWQTWSNGYSGEVYYSQGGSTLQITLPDDIVAFDFYLQPEQYQFINIEVTGISSTTTTASQSIGGNSGAEYFGFYTTNGDTLKTITITDKSGGSGFAMAQLRIAHVPEPLTIGGSVLALAFGWQMRKKRTAAKNTMIKR